MQVEREVPGAVSDVESHRAAPLAGALGDGAQIECLTGEEVGASNEDQRDGVVDELAGIGAAGHFDDRVGEAVEAGLRGDRIPVGGKGAFLDEDFVASRRGPVERDEEQVQVHRERIHRNDFALARAGDACERRGDELVIGHPRPLAREVALDGLAGPGVQLLFDVGAGPFRHEAERMTCEIERGRGRQLELGTKARERVPGVEGAGFVESDLHAEASRSRPSLDRPSQARAFDTRSFAWGRSASERMSAPGRSSPSGNG